VLPLSAIAKKAIPNPNGYKVGPIQVNFEQ